MGVAYRDHEGLTLDERRAINIAKAEAEAATTYAAKVAALHPAIIAAVAGYERGAGPASIFAGLINPAAARRARAEHLYRLRSARTWAKAFHYPRPRGADRLALCASLRRTERRLAANPPAITNNGFAVIIEA